MLTIKDISHSPHVKRWHKANVSREQNLAEHHYLVAMYAREMASKIIPDITAEEKLLLIEWCLVHDLPEIFTGDIPTPTKYLLKDYSENGDALLEKIENIVAGEEYQTIFNNIKHTKLKHIAKLADLTDALVFISEEGCGKQAKLIALKIREAFEDLVDKAIIDYPGYEWKKAILVLDEILFGTSGSETFELNYRDML